MTVFSITPVGGTATVGDVVTLSVYDATLSGGLVSDSYTVVSGDDSTAIATGLANAINSDSAVNWFVFAATSGPNITLFTFSQNSTSYRAHTNSTATETILLGTNTPIGGTSGFFGSTLFQYNNVNELIAISGGGGQLSATTSKPVKSGTVGTNTVNIQQTPIKTTYGVPEYSSATEVITLGQQRNGSAFLAVSGTITVGDVLSIIVFNSSLSGGQKQIFYTVMSGDSINSIASSMAAIVTADPDIAALGISAVPISQLIYITPTGTTYSSTMSAGATETIMLGFNNSGNISVNVGGSATAGDTLTITTTNAALSGGSESVTYTVLSGDTTVSMAEGLAAAINADTALEGIGLTATNSSPAIMNWSQAFSANPMLSAFESIASVIDYLQSQVSRRNTMIIILPTSPTQEKQMMSFLQDQNPEINPCDNCSTRIRDALLKGKVLHN
jgi:hypothetical protein